MSSPVIDRQLPAIVIGGGIGGLATAHLLARHYPRVVVLECDPRPLAVQPEDAFTKWERPGVPQFRHSHAFLARIRLVLLARLPDVLDRLRAAGAREIGLAEMAPRGVRFVPRADDEEVVLLACRRSTFEWALHESLRSQPTVELREGVRVDGLVGEARNGVRPTVTGVRLADGTILTAGLVVDTSGRRSNAPAWLTALGAPPPGERSAECGIFYYTRFYRLAGKRAPRGTTGLVAGDLGWVKLAIFPGDAGTFSITVGAPVADTRLRTLADPAQFERFVAAFPAIAPWRAPGVSVPIAGADTPVLIMGQLRNRLRRFVDRRGPLATGFVAIGDAAYHSNPIYGRGATSTLVQAALLDEALDRHPRDLGLVAVHLDRRSEAELRPFWEAAVSADRRFLGDRSLSLTNPLAVLASAAEEAFGWFVNRGLVPAMRVDPAILRGLMRVFNMLEPPDRLLRDPELLWRALPVLVRVLRGDAPRALFPVVPRAAALARLDDGSDQDAVATGPRRGQRRENGARGSESSPPAPRTDDAVAHRPAQPAPGATARR